MKKLVIEEPTEKQKLFLRAKKKYIAYGGARGGGKSWAVRVKAILLCLRFSGIKCMIVRKTYPELQENHIKPICATLKCYSGKDERIARYNDQKKTVRFDNGSEIIFRYCAGDKDAERFQGTEIDVLFIDEATHQTEDRFEKLRACVRGVNDFPKRIYLTCNPGGVGHGWVKRLFIDRNFKKNENPDDYMFIQAFVKDNTPLMRSDPDYIRKLEALSPKLRRAWLDGDWSVFEGQFFEEFTDDPEHYADGKFTHVIEPFEIPAHWKIYRSYDFGYAKPFSVGWWAVSGDGVVYRILEMYGCTGEPNEGVKWDKAKQFREVAEFEREHPWLRGKDIYGIADPSIWDVSRGESIAETAEKFGIYFEPGDNNRIAGWMQCHYRMAFDENGYPMMYVFKNCKDFIRTVPLLCYSETKPEDLDTEMEDHIADEWRYFLMSRPIAPRVAAAPEKLRIETDPLDQLRRAGGGVFRKY